LLLATIGLVSGAYILSGGFQSRGTSDFHPAQESDKNAEIIPVTIATVEQRDVPVWLSGIGSVQPQNAVTIKVRVDGQLQSVMFAEGQDVHAGEVLAQIDPRPFQAQIAQARANQAKDLAQLNNAKLDLQRYNSLVSNQYATRQSVDTTRATVAQLEAAIAADQSAIDMAQLQLDFATIKSPLDGRAGMRLVDEGSIVHPGDTGGLVVITQMAPIALLFTLSQDDLPAILAAQATGRVSVAAYSRDGAKLLASGTLAFIDSQVDAASGQVRLKADFDNKNRALWPGMLVTARLLARVEKGVLVAPSTTIQLGPNGQFVYVVRADRTVEVRPVQSEAVEGSQAVIRNGVKAGEQVVADGQYRLKAGSRVESRATVGP
jgi:multidrug efflux system membrane fusion protein